MTRAQYDVDSIESYAPEYASIEEYEALLSRDRMTHDDTNEQGFDLESASLSVFEY